LRRSLESFPRCVQLLHANRSLTAEWRNRFATLGTGLKIGVAWHGGIKAKDRKLRCLSLENLVPLLNVAGTQWINLQHGNVSQEIADLKTVHDATIHDWPQSDLRDDLENLAARIAACDLVISAGNAVVHLAGALGVPTWTLLPAHGAWRWGTSECVTPWYASVETLRQSFMGDWEGVIEATHRKLEDLFSPHESVNSIQAEQSPQIGSSKTTAPKGPRAANPIAAPHWLPTSRPATSSQTAKLPPTSREL
jgi:ADP-heptose:LPS heptosyltransferase